MTSLTVLTHAAASAVRAFNSDFYVTAATVIPVLFLAINVQPVFRPWGSRRPSSGTASQGPAG